MTTTQAPEPRQMTAKVLSVPDSITAAEESKDRLDAKVDQRHIASHVVDTR